MVALTRKTIDEVLTVLDQHTALMGRIGEPFSKERADYNDLRTQGRELAGNIRVKLAMDERRAAEKKLKREEEKIMVDNANWLPSNAEWGKVEFPDGRIRYVTHSPNGRTFEVWEGPPPKDAPAGARRVDTWDDMMAAQDRLYQGNAPAPLPPAEVMQLPTAETQECVGETWTYNDSDAPDYVDDDEVETIYFEGNLVGMESADEFHYTFSDGDTFIMYNYRRYEFADVDDSHS